METHQEPSLSEEPQETTIIPTSMAEGVQFCIEDLQNTTITDSLETKIDSLMIQVNTCPTGVQWYCLFFDNYWQKETTFLNKCSTRI